MIQFRTLGGISLNTATDHEVRSVLAHPRKIALLAYLAASRCNGTLARDSLLSIFWPEQDALHARAALRQAIHVLRGFVGADVLLTHGDHHVSLEHGLLWCDASAFEGHVAARRDEEALALFKGEFLDGFHIKGAPAFEDWLETRRVQLREAATAAAASLARRDIGTGNYDSAVVWARRLVQLAPDDEESVRYLVLALLRSGDRVGAIRVFDRYVHRIGQEYGLQPSTALYSLIGEVRERPSPYSHRAPLRLEA